MNDEMTPAQQEAAEQNARFQEKGISMEERVLALEEAMKALLERNADVSTPKFNSIQSRV